MLDVGLFTTPLGVALSRQLRVRAGGAFFARAGSGPENRHRPADQFLFRHDFPLDLPNGSQLSSAKRFYKRGRAKYEVKTWL